MDLDSALRQFERTEANLRQLEAVRDQMDALIPEGIVFAGSSPEGRQHTELCRRFDDLVSALPAIEGFRVDVAPMALDDIAQWRLDAFEASIPESLIDLDQRIAAPAEALADYRHRFERMRRQLIRARLDALIVEFDELLAAIRSRNPQEEGSVADDPGWPQLRDLSSQLQRVLADQASGRAWSNMARHLSFAQAVDLRDIVEQDWPAVRDQIQCGMYAEDEPLPVDVDDLAAVVAASPAGPVTTALAWDRLDDTGFERLIFNLLGDAPGYTNPLWLTATRAPDRGRDLSVERDLGDALGGSRHQRVMVQCKHWRSRSVRPTHAAQAVTQAEGWNSGAFDALIIATSGRFTIDAVNWIEQHNSRERLQVEMWAESHLEGLLAVRPWLVEQLGLRR